MKVLDIPKSGKCRGRVFYRLRRSQCWRVHVIPHNPRTAAQRRARKAFGAISKAWSELLTETQRQAWVARGAKVRSRPRLAQSGPLTGHMHFEGINSARARIGQGLLLWPPEPVVFGPNPVEVFTISYDNGRMRFKLKVPRPVTEDIMVFGQAPCSAGWRKWRHGVYLGLLLAPVGGESDITEMYVARFGEPKPGERVFIRTRQQVNGWESRNQDTNALVTPKPVAAEQSRTGISPVQSAIDSRWQAGRLPYYVAQWPDKVRISSATPATTVRCLMHQGVVPDQHWIMSQATRMQCRWNKGCGRAIGRVGRVWSVCAPGEGARDGPWYELWHHS